MKLSIKGWAGFFLEEGGRGPAFIRKKTILVFRERGFHSQRRGDWL